jgi:flavin reductase (DIM6/NTAB) family NADH-FMN oxidoreductase RutF
MAQAEDLKRALRRIVRSVVVVTARRGDRAYAMAATAVSEVSLDPPSMLVCVNRKTSLFAALDTGAPLALNVLSSDHEAVSRACGGGARGDARFAVGAWHDAGTGAPPILRDACAVILLDQARTLDHGTHRIIVGNVTDVLFPGAATPLAYFDGAYLPIESALPA